MIAPKVAKQTAAEETWAYQKATERDHGCCVRCGAFGVQRDHRKNRSQTGRTTPGQLQCLCFSAFGREGCHEWKGKHPKLAAAEGWAVPGWVEDPLTYPARRRISPRELIWVIYDDLGGWRRITDDEALARIAGTFDGEELPRG